MRGVKRNGARLALMFLTIAFLLEALPVMPAQAASDNVQNVQADAKLKQIYLSMPNIPGNEYYTYIRKYEGKWYAGETREYAIADLAGEQNVQDGGIQIAEGENWTCTLEVPEEGVYYIGFDYLTTGDNILPNNISMMVNGEYPFAELKRLVVDNTWVVKEDAFPVDRYGNEVVPMPVKLKEWKTTYLHSADYLFSKPMGVYLKKGVNTLSIRCDEGGMRLGNFHLAGEKTLPGYDETQAPEGHDMIVIEAERMTRRNSPNIRPTSEYNLDVTPYSAKGKVMNLVADTSFKTGGNRIEYDFEVRESGYYNIGFRYRQSEKANFPVFRNIYIDGKIPYDVLENVPFAYNKKFENYVASTSEGQPITLLLEKGAHTLSMEVSLDYVRDAVKILTRVANEMNDLTLDLSKITGGNTDKYRDFQLEEFDFDIKSKLVHWAELIDSVYAELARYNPKVKNVGELALLKIAASTMRMLAEKPDELPKRLNIFSRGQTSVRQNLTTMIERLNQSPLGLDKIFLFQNKEDLPRSPGFFRVMVEKVKRFFYSFSEQDYEVNSSKQNTKNLQVWVNRPRQYLDIIQKMADTGFAEKYGFHVDLSLMPDPNKLILANASGNAPDLAMSTSAGLTYDLAVRGALQNLREFDTFKQVASRVSPGLLIPGVSRDGLYALPETFDFWVLFYRKDILDSLGLSVPDTMDDVYKMLPQLQRRGLNFNSHVSNFIGYKPYATTIPFIYQNGGILFRQGEVKSALDSKEALAGITKLTENYTVYNMSYEVQSFYQSFRDGRLPIGVSSYGTFNLLVNAAPEIADLWDIAPYPGVKNEKGEVERWTLGAAESCIMFRSGNKKEAAWDFLDWWTSAQVQTEFAYTLQSTLGNEYLWNPANTEAMMNTPWIKKHKEIIRQTQWVREPPRILGGYMIERELSNAVNAVVLDGKNVRSTMDEAIKRINREVIRKLEEFGYMKDGKLEKPYNVPDIDTVKKWVD